MGDFEDMAGRLTSAMEYLDPAVINHQIAAVEGVIVTLLGISSINPVIVAEINALTLVQDELKRVATALQIRTLRLTTIARNLRGGFTS